MANTGPHLHCFEDGQIQGGCTSLFPPLTIIILSLTNSHNEYYTHTSLLPCTWTQQLVSQWELQLNLLCKASINAYQHTVHIRELQFILLCKAYNSQQIENQDQQMTARVKKREKKIEWRRPDLNRRPSVC